MSIRQCVKRFTIPAIRSFCFKGLILFLPLWMGSLFNGCHHSILASQPGEESARPSSTGKEWFAKGIQSYRQGRYEEAIKWIETSLQTFQGVKEYQYHYLLLAYQRLGDCGKGVNLSREFEKRFPDSALLEEVLFEEGQCHQRLSEYTSAADIYKRLLEERAQELDSTQKRKIQLSYADVLVHMGRIEEGLSVYMGIRRQWPQSAEDLAAREHVQVIYGRYPQYRSSGINALLEEAQLTLAEGNFSTSRSLYGTIIRKQPALPVLLEAYSGQILCLVRSGGLTEAEAITKSLVTHHPDAVQTRKALFSVGRAFWLKDKVEPARRLLKYLVEHYTDSEEATQGAYILGRTYMEEGALTESARQFMRTRFLYPDTPWEKESCWYEAWVRYLNGEYETSSTLLADWLSAGTDKTQAPKAAYWRARCLEKMGKTDESQAAYEEILMLYQDSFYRTLAAKRLHAHSSLASLYRMQPPLEFPPAIVAQPLTLPDPQIPDLLEVGLTKEAIDRMDRMRMGSPYPEYRPLELIKAYYLGGAYPRAILMAQGELSKLGETGGTATEELEKSLLVITYPLFYWDLIRKYAAQAGLDPFLLAALIRQESHFVPISVSQAGAVGLMQIMPKTAKRIASTLGLRDIVSDGLMDPETNIQVGTRYISDLALKYGNDWTKVLAAYNAGDDAAQKWLDRDLYSDTEEFIETITFPETQQYVKKVLFNWNRYKELYEGNAG